MAKAREALLIAVGDYQDPGLRRLRSPEADAAALRDVLEDQSIGCFGVEVQLDQPSHVTRRAIQRFFANRSLDDVLLFHISSHGVKDDDGRLYFASSDTELGLLDATAVSASYLNEQMDRCRARTIVMLLDCCYSGAFAPGSKSDRSPHLKDTLGGTGRAILTASNALEYAWEGDELSGEPVGSTFTSAIISGLQSGEADRNHDGFVSIDDLYDHVHEAALAGGRRQTPQKYLFGVSGSLVIANTPPSADPLKLPAALEEGIASPLVRDRLTAVSELAVLSFFDGAMATLANAALAELANDDSRQVSAAATEALRSPGEPRPRATPGPHATNGDRPDSLLAGIDLVAALVARTFGPEPRVVLLGDGFETSSTMDPQEIVEGIELERRMERAGSVLVKEVVQDVAGQHQDGAATAAIIFQALSSSLDQAVALGANPSTLRRSLGASLKKALAHLGSQGVEVQTKEQLERGISVALGDPLVARMVVEAIDKVGKDGVIIVEESSRIGLSLELCEGMRFNAGYISHFFITDQERNECVLVDPYVLIADLQIGAIMELLPLLEKVMQSGRPLLIICQDVEGEALSTLVVNMIRATFKSVAVRAPGFGDRRKAVLGDIAVLTGGQIVPDESGTKLEVTDLDQLGQARKVIVSKEDTTIVEGAGGHDRIVGRVNQIRAEIEMCDSDYDRERLQERLAKIAGGVAIIQVGGMTEAAVQQGMKVARRGVSISSSMVSTGMTPGGGSALARTAQLLRRDVSLANSPKDETTTDLAMADALEAPLRVLCINSGSGNIDDIVDRVGQSGSRVVCNVLTGQIGEEELWEPLGVQVGAVMAAARGADRFLSHL